MTYLITERSVRVHTVMDGVRMASLSRQDGVTRANGMGQNDGIYDAIKRHGVSAFSIGKTPTYDTMTPFSLVGNSIGEKGGIQADSRGESSSRARGRMASLPIVEVCHD